MPQPRRDLADLLEPCRDDLDQLVAELRAKGAGLSHRDYDRLEEDACRICKEVRAAFRGNRR